MPSLIRGLADVMMRPVIPWADAASRESQVAGKGHGEVAREHPTVGESGSVIAQAASANGENDLQPVA